MTIRGVPEEVVDKLLRMSRERGLSINGTVLEILNGAVGGDARRKQLARYATWTSEDLDEVQNAVAEQRVIDDSIWK